MYDELDELSVNAVRSFQKMCCLGCRSVRVYVCGAGVCVFVACVQTPLSLAAKAGCVPAVKMLIAAGANIDHKDDDVEVGTR